MAPPTLADLRRRRREPPRQMGSLARTGQRVLVFGRRHRQILSPALDVLCIAFIALLYMTSQTVMWVHLVYISLFLGAFIRGGALPTLIRSSAYTVIMLAYLVHMSAANDDFLEIPLMWVISVLAAGLAEVNEGSAREFERLAATDHLTGLPNRRWFEEHLADAARASFAVLAVDVDGLKAMNDRFGHESGDAILAAVARAIRSAVREKDLAARLGGDEFAVVLIGADVVVAAEISERICAAVRAEPVAFGPASVSVGWATAEPTQDVAEVMERADRALYRAKTEGRDRVAGAACLPVGGGAAGRGGHDLVA